MFSVEHELETCVIENFQLSFSELKVVQCTFKNVSCICNFYRMIVTYCLKTLNSKIMFT